MSSTLETETPEMTWATALKERLDTIQYGTFGTSGALEGPTPLVEVEGFGSIGVPFNHWQADGFKAIATKCGSDNKKLSDEADCDTWEVGADKVTVGGKNWSEQLTALVDEMAFTLGILDATKSGVEPRLHKLLMCEAGRNAKPRKDFLKAHGAFGTLVIQLPSKCEGAKATIEHNGDVKNLDLSKKEAIGMDYMAFYADCTHEMHSLTEGYCLALVYNLVSADPNGMGYCAAHSTQMMQEVTDLIATWPAKERRMLGYKLDYRYPLLADINKLQGRDKMVASVLQNVRIATTDADIEGNHMVDLEIKEQRNDSIYYGTSGDGKNTPSDPKKWLLPRNDGWNIYKSDATDHDVMSLVDDCIENDQYHEDDDPYYGLDEVGIYKTVRLGYLLIRKTSKRRERFNAVK